MSTSARFSIQCPPGTRMLLELSGLEDKLGTVCVGYQRGRFIIVQMPPSNETGREVLHQMLYPDNTVIVRYLYEGLVVGFSARIIKYIPLPFPLLFLTFPRRLESHALRKHKRVSCCVPGNIRLDEAVIPGMLTDLSVSGCQFSFTYDGPAPDLPIDAAVNLNCDLLVGNDNGTLHCIVKRADAAANKMDIGLKFKTMSEQTREALTAYLDIAVSVLR